MHELKELINGHDYIVKRDDFGQIVSMRAFDPENAAVIPPEITALKASAKSNGAMSQQDRDKMLKHCFLMLCRLLRQ